MVGTLEYLLAYRSCKFDAHGYETFKFQKTFKNQIIYTYKVAVHT